MGLLDQVLGQVLGGMGGQQGGPMRGQGAGMGAGMGAGTGGAMGGGLGGLLSGNRAPIAMALLALLASKHLGNGAGGYGSALRDMFSGGSSGGQAPGDVMQGGTSSGGGILGGLGGMLGGAGSGAGPGSSLGGLGGILGGGLTGGALAGGLGDLLGRFNQAGHADVANSWVQHGPNAAISPDQLGDVLDPTEIDELSRHTGLDRGDLLSQLSSALPQVVDKLTPQGRLPSEDEHSDWV